MSNNVIHIMCPIRKELLSFDTHGTRITNEKKCIFMRIYDAKMEKGSNFHPPR